MKKILSFAVASAMVASMGVASFATSTITKNSAYTLDILKGASASESEAVKASIEKNFVENSAITITDRNVAISIDSSKMDKYTNSNMEATWFCTVLEMGEALTYNASCSEEHGDYEKYEVMPGDIGPQDNWGAALDTNTEIVFWLRAEAPKRVACFKDASDVAKCVTFEITDTATPAHEHNYSMTFESETLNVTDNTEITKTLGATVACTTEGHTGEINPNITFTLKNAIDGVTIENTTLTIAGTVADKTEIVVTATDSVTSATKDATFTVNRTTTPIEHEHNYSMTFEDETLNVTDGTEVTKTLNATVTCTAEGHTGEINPNITFTLKNAIDGVTIEDTTLTVAGTIADKTEIVVTATDSVTSITKDATFTVSTTGEEVTPPTPETKPDADDNNEPTQSEIAAEEAKTEVTETVSKVQDIADEIKAITGGLPVATAGTASAEKLEKLCKDAGLKTVVVEANGKKTVAPVISLDLGKMEGKLSYTINDMVAGSGMFLEFKATDGKTYMVATASLSKSAPNRIYFTESYLIGLAINK